MTSQTLTRREWSNLCPAVSSATSNNLRGIKFMNFCLVIRPGYQEGFVRSLEVFAVRVCGQRPPLSSLTRITRISLRTDTGLCQEATKPTYTLLSWCLITWGDAATRRPCAMMTWALNVIALREQSFLRWAIYAYLMRWGFHQSIGLVKRSFSWPLRWQHVCLQSFLALKQIAADWVGGAARKVAEMSFKNKRRLQ